MVQTKWLYRSLDSIDSFVYPQKRWIILNAISRQILTTIHSLCCYYVASHWLQIKVCRIYWSLVFINSFTWIYIYYIVGIYKYAVIFLNWVMAAWRVIYFSLNRAMKGCLQRNNSWEDFCLKEESNPGQLIQQASVYLTELLATSVRGLSYLWIRG